MKRGLFNIEANTITPLIEEGVDSGSISSVRMTNTSTASVVVELTIDEGVNQSHLVQTTIPAKTTLLVDDELAFNNSIFTLNLKTSGGSLASSAPLSVIVK
tara:strand:- start:207 stop:509 length:303 start_codon:yes stop_codon:yes gene_type:complete